MRRLPIGRKLAVALAGPLAALVVLTLLEVVDTASHADRVVEQTELAKSSIGPAGIITALQNERTWLAIELIGQAGAVTVPVEGTEETRAETDAALAAFRDGLEGRTQLVVDAFREPLDGLEERLAEVRRRIDSDPRPHDVENLAFTDEIFATYTDLIGPFFSATTRVALAIDDPELRQGAELADAVARQIEVLSRLLNRTITDASLSPGGIDQPEEITQIAMLHADFREYAEQLRDASGPYAVLAERWYPEDFTARVDEQVDSALATGGLDLEVVLEAVNVPRDEGYIGYQDTLHRIITDRADELRTSAERRQVWFAAVALGALASAVVLTWLVSRSITRPLRRLTREAKEMATHRLPDAVMDILETPLGDDVQVPRVAPVSVRTRDEVGDVALALNTVQDSALHLAVEQAVLRRNIADSFVNLGRRNQSLLGRQLDFITELESNETTPETLASLFRLDHLATRMRRNAESLLVLAGVEPPRRWAAPVRLTDVIRAALGEVEDYQRVVIRDVEPATVLGSAAADLAHLIAELLENALTFSPPDQTVEVRGRSSGPWTGPGGGPGAGGGPLAGPGEPPPGAGSGPGAASGPGGYVLAVVDRGFGMPDEDLVQANRRLSGTESFTIAPSKYLGHYVAGNLAARHRIRIQLGRTPGHGITATVDLPPDLLTTEAPVGGPITDPHGSRAVGSRARPAVPAGSGAASGGGGATQAAPEPPPGPTAFAPPPADSPAAPEPAAGPGSPSPSGPAWSPPSPPSPPASRTPSGLAKRPSRRGGQPPDRSPAPILDADLLAELSRHTRRAGGPAAPGPSGLAFDAPTGPPAGAPPPTPAGPAFGTPPGHPPSGGSPYAPGPATWPAPAPGTAAPAGGQWPAPGTTGPSTPAAGGQWPAPGTTGADTPGRGPTGAGDPGQPGPTSPSTPAAGGQWPDPAGTPGPRRAGTADPGAPGAPGSRPAGAGAPGQAGRTGLTATGDAIEALRAVLERSRQREGTPGERRRAAPPAGPAPDPGAGGTTAGGLPRRVRGAQLPTAEPLSLRRGGAAQPPPANQPPASPPPGPPPGPTPPGPGPAPRPQPQSAAAEDVYSFLTNFTTGVQRGLDEARRSDDAGPGT